MSTFISPLALQEARGPIDGRRFFSQSPFRSWNFLAVSAECFVGIVYAFYLMYSHWYGWFGSLVYSSIVIGFVYSWFSMLFSFQRVRDLDHGVALKDVEPGSPLDVALGAAAWAPLQTLIYCYGVMIVTEAMIGHLLSRAGI
jgi:hypothetical protein